MSEQPTSPSGHEFLAGEAIYLRSLEMADRDRLWAWFADLEVVRYSLSIWQFPVSRIETQEWLDQTIRDKKTLTLGIVERSSGRFIGFAGITGISVVGRSGEYFIFIGDKSCWSKGYGAEATKLIVNYGFAGLNLHRIALTVSDVNVGGVKAYQRVGFVTEGRLRDASYRDGRYHDKIVMSILRPEWRSSTSSAIR